MTRCLIIPGNAVFHASVPLLLVELAEEEIIGDDRSWFPVAIRDGAQLYRDTRDPLGAGENFVATALAHETNSISVADIVTGSVVVVGEPGDDGVHRDVPDALLDYLVELGCATFES